MALQQSLDGIHTRSEWIKVGINYCTLLRINDRFYRTAFHFRFAAMVGEQAIVKATSVIDMTEYQVKQVQNTIGVSI